MVIDIICKVAIIIIGATTGGLLGSVIVLMLNSLKTEEQIKQEKKKRTKKIYKKIKKLENKINKLAKKL